MRLPSPVDLFKAKPAARVRDALERAQARAGGEGRLIGISAGLLGLSFILLAVTAPLGFILPGLLSTLVSIVPLGVLVAGLVIGAIAFGRVMRADDSAIFRPGGGPPTLAQESIAVALGEAEDSGLKPNPSRVFFDALSGRIGACPIVVAVCDGGTYCVIRLPLATMVQPDGPLLVTPGARPWPGPLPQTVPLTPLTPPVGLALQAWGDKAQRDKAQALLVQIAPSLQLATAAGAMPYVSLLNRTFVLYWPAADATGALVVAADLIGRLPKVAAG